MYDWQESQEPDGSIVARLCATRVVVRPTGDDAGGAWAWEVRFADGQVQLGRGGDPDDALEKGKRVAERFLP